MSTDDGSVSTSSYHISTKVPEAAGFAAQHDIIRIAQERVPAEVDGRPAAIDLFTMTLGQEAIYLLPLKTWSQLDTHKWRVRGKLPGTPAGLEIALDHVKIAGTTVCTTDPDGCEKLEQAFNDWAKLEWEALEKSKQKPREPALQSSTTPASQQEESLRFKVELDKAGQAHIRCLEGKDTVANVACTVPGITSLLNAGLLRKPGSWKVGALRDWLELDGEVFRLKDGEAAIHELERALNDRYHPASADGATQAVKVFVNPGSASGFDIQFPATDNGLTENRRRHLDPAAIDLLSDPQRCRVLRKGLVVKFTPPTFRFKQKTSEGGECELERTTDNIVEVVAENGQRKWIDLSEPVSHLGLGAAELTAVFNHPSILRRVRRADDQHSQDFRQAA